MISTLRLRPPLSMLSGAVCAAMLDFAWSAGIGFSTVVALGDYIDHCATRNGLRQHLTLFGDVSYTPAIRSSLVDQVIALIRSPSCNSFGPSAASRVTASCAVSPVAAERKCARTASAD
jgi:hypothetical protein